MVSSLCPTTERSCRPSSISLPAPPALSGGDCRRRSRRSPSWERTPRAFREPKAAPNLSTACAGHNRRQGTITMPNLRNRAFSCRACIQQATSNDQLESVLRRDESPNQANPALKPVNRSPHWTTDPDRNPRPISRKSPFTRVELGTLYGRPSLAAPSSQMGSGSPSLRELSFYHCYGLRLPEPANTQLLSLLWAPAARARENSAFITVMGSGCPSPRKLSFYQCYGLRLPEPAKNSALITVMRSGCPSPRKTQLLSLLC